MNKQHAINVRWETLPDGFRYSRWTCNCWATGLNSTPALATEAGRAHERKYNTQEEDMKNTNRRGVPAKKVTSKTIATFHRKRRYYRVYDNDGVRSQWTDKETAIEQARVANNNGEVKTWVVEYEEDEE